MVRVRKGLILRIYDAANMQRWNDKIRPVDLRELDKQAHKMIIAYMLGKFEEKNKDFDWVEVIEGGFFEFLQRLVVTDLKPQVLDKIRHDPSKWHQLNKWAYKELLPFIQPLGKDFCNRFESYFSDIDNTVNKRILSSAHFYATKWEFRIIEHANPGGYEIKEIKQHLENRLKPYSDLAGMRELDSNPHLDNFIDLCGMLRFQLRWSHIHREPRTSVLGHMLIVALLSYLFSLQMGTCPRRYFNNYFSALFHDLPEVLTKDIISPIKVSVEGLDDLIKEYEREQMDKEVYGLIPREWHQEIKMFTEGEFRGVVTLDNKVAYKSSEDINRNYNHDVYNARDGEVVKAADNLAAFLEAYLALRNGIVSSDLEEAKWKIRSANDRQTIGGINLGEIYADFD